MDHFFSQPHLPALTFDDVTLATCYSEVLPKDTRLETSLSDRLQLSTPILSSDMDTVTEWQMAVAMALHGGLGILHANMSESEQIQQVKRVKHFIHGMIQEPVCVNPDQTIASILHRIDHEGLTFNSFPVIDAKGVLLGFLPGQAVKHRNSTRSVAECMELRSRLHTILEEALGDDPIATADRFFHEHIGIHKLLVVDRQDHLRGLFTLNDIERISEEARSLQKPTRDSSFRLACAASISVPRNAEGAIDKKRLTEHVAALIEVGADAIAISTAHGHSQSVGDSVKILREAFKDLTLIAGNVTTAAGVEFLAQSGASTIKVGQGPGSICTTRLVAGVGIPQLTALYAASEIANKLGVRILADGGITKSGDIVKALTLADAVICGGLLAGCPEAPGKILEIDGKRYKEYRGMGSLEAMKAGSAARYGHQAKDQFRKVAAEGIQALKEVQSPLHQVLSQLLGGVQSGLGYLGAKNLAELKLKARFVQVSPAGQRESAPHDVVEIKTSQRS
ncbi:MAG: malate dehydrogenase [Verrucomicrobia bacterium 21-51-4]|nr:MAG: malate dehydrogenase [Verrucomicrobia bacterium 21-51-4]